MTLLIVFAVLLLLLTLLSTFGGSIRTGEPFYEPVAAAQYDPVSEYYTAASDMPAAASMPAAVPSAMPGFEPPSVMPSDAMSENFANAVPTPSIPSIPPPPVVAPKKMSEEGFAIEPFEDENKASLLASF